MSSAVVCLRQREKVGSMRSLVFFRLFAIFYIVAISLSATSKALAQGSSEDQLPNIIIITFSSVRRSETLDDPTHQYIPYLWNKLFPEGVLYTDLVNLNNPFHTPVFFTINTGMIYPFYRKSLINPSIFQYVRKKYNLPPQKIWSIGHWFSRDCVLRTDDYPEDTYPCVLSIKDLEMSGELKDILTKQELILWERFCQTTNENPEQWPHWDSLGPFQYRFFKKILQRYKPKLVHYIMNDVEIAHSDTYSKYVLALKACDARIYDIWNFIQADPFYKGRTYLIVNVDHERNAYYMEHYEHSYVNPSSVWMYVYGPGVKKGIVIRRPVHHADIFVTVARLMDVETHTAEGEFLRDCFSAESALIARENKSKRR